MERSDLLVMPSQHEAHGPRLPYHDSSTISNLLLLYQRPVVFFLEHDVMWDCILAGETH